MYTAMLNRILTLLISCSLYVCASARSQTYDNACNVKNETSQIIKELLTKYGGDGKLTNTQFRNLWNQLRDSHSESHVVFKELTSYNNGSPEVINNSSADKCLTVDDIFNIYSDADSSITARNLPPAALSLVHLILNDDCESDEPHGLKPSSAQVWGYGLGFVTLVCVISNVGGLLAPFMQKAFFQKLLTFLVSMAVGTLAATGLLVLLPEAFHIMSCEKIADDYLWKAATAMAGIYIFYMSERILKIIFYRPKNHSDQSIDIKIPLAMENEHNHSHLPSNIDSEIQSGERSVSTVAWMVLIGDALHNFVDGLSIGAAFTENIYTGVSVSIAVVCEELPHELGDVAILLHSGLSMKRALLYNFLAAVICYVGLIIGILLGENTSANRWIFAIAGGLFLYVSLVDMLPELNHTAEEFQRQKANPWKIMALQTFGLIVGFGIILVVAFYAHQIVIN